MVEERLTLWDFAVTVYRQEGVAAACLDLQERAGVDVPLLLHAAWLARQGVALTPDALALIDDEIAAWREEVIHPLRALRRRMKSGPLPAPSAETDALRERVKTAELEAERIELALLEASAPAPARDAQASVTANLRTVLRHFSPVPVDAEDSALATIQAATEP